MRLEINPMLKKIISIKNVGRFRNSAAPGNRELARHTFIVGANGYGKTTICAVMRSLKTGDASHIVGRKTLGVSSHRNDAPAAPAREVPDRKNTSEHTGREHSLLRSC